MAIEDSSKKADEAAAQPALTEAEWAIMRVVWEEGPCAAGTVQEALASSKGWAYSTVKTTMDRMLKKGLLRSKSIRNLQLFSARITEEQAKRGEIAGTLKRAFDGGLTPLVLFLLEHETFSSEDLQRLRQMVDKARQSGRDKQAKMKEE